MKIKNEKPICRILHNVFMGILLLSMITGVGFGKTIFVDATASGVNNGSSWVDAYNFLQDGLDDADPCDVIWVAQGTYYPTTEVGGTGSRYQTFRMKNGVGIYGGFPDTGNPGWPDRDPNTYVTILSGDLDGNDSPPGSGGGIAGETCAEAGPIYEGETPFDTTDSNTEESGPPYKDIWYVYTATASGDLTVSLFGSSFDTYLEVYEGGACPPAVLLASNDDFWDKQSEVSLSVTQGNQYFIRVGGVSFFWFTITAGPGVISIKRDARDDNSYHVVTGSGTDPNAILDGFTITGGYADGIWNTPSGHGGGMYNKNGSPTLANCTFSENMASLGGGMYNYRSSSTMTNCIFSNNSTTGNYGVSWNSDGGGMYNYGGSPTLTNCTFRGNRTGFVGNGGGLCSTRFSSSTLTNCTFSGNFAQGSGGGMYVRNSDSKLTNCAFIDNSANVGGGMWGGGTLTNCTFSNNRAISSGIWWLGGGGMSTGGCSTTLIDCIFNDNYTKSNGGGLLCSGGSPTLTNCSFRGNYASDEGGGMYISGDGEPLLTNCIFSDNYAYHGGGVFNRESNSVFTNCIFSGNSTRNYGEGGGMYTTFWGRSTINNCTFSGNEADCGGGICSQCGGYAMGSNCILWGNTASNGNEIYGAASISYSCVQGGHTGIGNIDADPFFVDLGHWDDNGTPDNTYDDFWVDGNYHLRRGSPCIDAGTNAGVYEDIEGNIRPWDYPGVDNNGPDEPEFDMGAHEFVNAAPVADAGPDQTVYAGVAGVAEVTLDGSGSYDSDGDALTYKWNWEVEGEVFTSTGGDGIVDMRDFAAVADKWMQTGYSCADIAPPGGDGIVDVLDLYMLAQMWLITPDSLDWDSRCDIVPDGANPTIELPIGEHIIELVVNDGIEDSDPNEMVVNVVGPIEGDMWVLPPVVVRRGWAKHIMVIIRLPESIGMDQIDQEETLVLYPGNIEATRQWFIERNGRVKVFAFFSKADLLAAVEENGTVKLQVEGKLQSGQYFYGSDSIMIIDPHW